MLPSGPRLPKLVQTAQWIRDPVGYIEACKRRYGPVFRLRFVGLDPFVYVTDPALARTVYAADRTVCRAGEGRGEFLTPLVGEHSLLVTEGDDWLRHRKLLGPVFHRTHIESYAQEIERIAVEAIERWPLGEPLNLRERMQEITLEVMLRIVFGVTDEHRLSRYRELLPKLGDGIAGPLMFIAPTVLLKRERLMRSFPNPIRTFLETRAEVDKLIYADIAERRANPRQDVLSMLLADMSDAELRDELITLLEAGHETTATALAWTFERLVRHPETDVTDIDALTREALRTRPVVPDTPRRLAGPLTVGDYELPGGWFVTVAITSVQLEGGDDFRPERWHEGPAPPWIPFGGGKRHCVGSHLALLEMRIVIAAVLARFELEAVDPAPERQVMHHVTIAPSAGGRVIARDRDHGLLGGELAAGRSGHPV